MNWWTELGDFLINNQWLCGLLLVLFSALYIAVIIFECKWGD